VRENPEAWLPWNYEEALATLMKKLKPDKAA